MYDYLKNELEIRSLTYAEVVRYDLSTGRLASEVTFVIATNKDSVIEAGLEFKDNDFVLLSMHINNGDFNSALRDYMNGTLNGANQEINVYHNENVVQLK